MIKVGIFGSEGRMGKDIFLRSTHFKDIKIVYLCEHKGHKSIGSKRKDLTVGSDISRLIELSDVIIDFSNADATINLLKMVGNSKKKPSIVSGTTGFSKIQEKKFANFSKGLRTLRSFNMSLGINLLKSLLSISAKNLIDLADVEIFEIHHNKKKDIPSGTALTLADSIKRGNHKIKNFSFREKSNNKVRAKNEIGFSSIRGGDVIGEHSVYFFLDGETIKFTHSAQDRKVFSDGALRASVWINNQKDGLYSTIDMLDI